LASVYLESGLVARLGQALRQGTPLAAALHHVIADDTVRRVHHAPLDVRDDAALRVVQVVTSLQQGGAERLVLDLCRQLGGHGVRPLLVTLGRPTRASFPVPAGTVDLAEVGSDRQTRIAALAEVARSFAADLIHAHLLDGEDMQRLAVHGFPTIATVHNSEPGWPAGLERLQAGDVGLLVGCAQAVERELRAARLHVPIRAVWNGIDTTPFAPTPALHAAAANVRRNLGLTADDFVLLALANPRPQKRIHLLPAVLEATRRELMRRGHRRQVRLVLAGSSGRDHVAAEQATAAIHAEIARFGLEASVCWAGAIQDVAPLLAAVDVLVSTSAYEGLSLAQLEALAAGKPVVATDVGGTAEVARDHPELTMLPRDASPQQFAEVLAALAQQPAQSRPAALTHFRSARMVEQYTRLYPRAIAAVDNRRPRQGLWLVTNNFSTGGAQSSARRLLLELQRRGIPVRAAVLQEEPDNPTPGRQALLAAGIPVLALPPPGSIDPAQAVTSLLERLDMDRPGAVVLWNALAEYKILLADGLLDTPVFDVSPGEMYFASLERYFRQPRPGLPYRSGRDYGARLAGVIVKYAAEAARAADVLGSPVHVIGNGVPTDVAPSKSSERNGQLVLGTLARIAPHKKLEELLAALRRAAPRLPPHRLRIAGGVEHDCQAYAEQLHDFAAGLSVEWLGDVQPVDAFLRELDGFVLVAEPAGCPNASLEAMAAGLAIVATDVGGMAEQVVDGVTGRLVPRGDCTQLAEAIVELAQNPDKRLDWGAAGRARVEARFSLRRMVDDYSRVCLGMEPPAS
jgi:glycosyltransferase involved in cell wall biosynthesis